MKLTKEEQEILDAYESGEYTSIPNAKEEMSKYREYAKSTLKKNKRINIRVSERDLFQLKRKAVSEGIPYQTLVTSILHKYLSGTLVNIE